MASEGLCRASPPKGRRVNRKAFLEAVVPTIITFAGAVAVTSMANFGVVEGWAVFAAMSVTWLGVLRLMYRALQGYWARQEADKFSAMRVVVMETLLHGARVVDAKALVLAAQDERLWDAWDDYQNEELRAISERIREQRGDEDER